MANAQYFRITVNGVALPCPSKYQWGWQRVSAAESGRTESGLMLVNQVTVKRKIELEWAANDNLAEVSKILKAFRPQYISVRYFDFMDNQWETRIFYTGDMQVPLKCWFNYNQSVENIAFNIIER